MPHNFFPFSHENILTRSSSSLSPCFFKKPTIITTKEHHIKTISKLSRKRGFFIFIVTLEIIHERVRKISTFIEFFSPYFSVSSRIAPKDGKETTMEYKRAQRRGQDNVNLHLFNLCIPRAAFVWIKDTCFCNVSELFSASAMWDKLKILSNSRPAWVTNLECASLWRRMSIAAGSHCNWELTSHTNSDS